MVPTLMYKFVQVVETKKHKVTLTVTSVPSSSYPLPFRCPQSTGVAVRQIARGSGDDAPGAPHSPSAHAAVTQHQANIIGKGQFNQGPHGHTIVTPKYVQRVVHGNRC